MLALVAAAESWLAWHDVDFANYSAECWRMSGWAARRVRRSEILCFGTSLSKHGVLPRVIERQTGKRAYNLAVFSGPASASYFLLRRALEAGVCPRAVLIDCQDGPLDPARRQEREGGLTSNMRYWPELLELRDCFDLAWSARDAGFFVEMMLARTFPSYRCRFEVRSSILAQLQGRDESHRLGVAALRRNWAINRGAHVRQLDRVFANQLALSDATPENPHYMTFTARDRARNTLALSYVRRFLDLADAHGITVFWLLLPVTPERRVEYDRSGMDDYLTRVARMALSHSRNVIVIDGRHSGYTRWGFSDRIHLDRYGAVAFSTDVASVVGRALSRPESVARWSVLPTCRRIEPSVPVEDLAQSLSVLKSQEVRR
ncbi:MAG: hypothetical protein JO284_05960 [Planctomycetaceae bacterium]|nr:hypothetical protein [Planctomycetaceae bacterium]MBV8228493.1 hypothetical protein [Planctomycetaceae bacterium]MBV8316220.1 hypothetical protein [Planctomycetaceae bacterium]MBV8556274.1 hypothetical protein [Planctomycetaceae bacterium]